MGVIRRTAASYKDYTDIWLYVARQSSPDVADRLLRTFDSNVSLLSDHPGAGPTRPEIRPNLRSFPVGSYVIYYRRIRGGIELIRVIHGARDQSALFRRRR